MVKELHIRHIPNHEIDRVRWDRCISAACNHSPYALSDYLDALTPGWEALILGDYEFVMPLPVRKKYGIRYLYQPFLIPYLGIFGPSLSEACCEPFLLSIPKNIRWVDIILNPSCTSHLTALALKPRTNYFLSLEKDYSTIRSHYRQNHLRNISRAEKAGCVIDRNITPEEIFELAETYLGPRGHFKTVHKTAFLELMNRWLIEKRACTYGVRLNGKLMASAIFLLYKERAYYLLVGNHPDGKTLGASHALIDGFIKDHAGKKWILDFEGSDIPSLAFFYEGFGSAKEFYGWLQINRLPAWIAWIKS